MKRTLDNLLVKWKGLAPQRRILLAAAVATLLIGGYMLTSSMNAVTWAVLYANVDDATASNVMASLDGKGIQYKLDGNGTRILVPVESLDTTRIALANEGISGQAVPDGFAEIFDNQGLSTTDFAQQVNYERALEGELARTVLEMEAVDGASVQLSIPEKSIFVGASSDDQDKPTASVLIEPAKPLTQEEVDTIANLISSSVPGLAPADITVASTDGTLLKSPGGGGLGASGSDILEQTQAYEASMSQRLTKLVRDITGSNDASVEVRAELDFTEKSVEQRTVDPTNNTPTAETRSEETWEGTGVVPGGVAGVDGGPTDATSDGTGSYTKLDETITYTMGDETVTKQNSTTPTIVRLGVAVVIPPLPEDAAITAADIENAVRSAASLQDDRGDSITVIEALGAAMAGEEGVDADGGLVTDPVVAPVAGISPMFVVIAAVFGAVLMLAVLGFRKKRRGKKAALAAALAAMSDPTLVGLAPVVAEAKKAKKKKRKKGEPEEEAEAVPALIGPDLAGDKAAMEEIRSDLEKILNESPESLATLLSSWMTK